MSAPHGYTVQLGWDEVHDDVDGMIVVVCNRCQAPVIHDRDVTLIAAVEAANDHERAIHRRT